MKSKIAVLLFSLSFLCQNGFTGAWDVGSFDNDDASDWVYELESSTGLSTIGDALSAASDVRGYIEAPTGSVALAAAEVVAALLGNPHPQLPPEVVAWVNGKSVPKDSQLVELARRAIANVKDSTRSELAQLWSESGDALEEWESSVSDLERRLH